MKDDPKIPKLALEKPTGYLIWDDGVLNQEFKQIWTRWNGNFWQDSEKIVWRPVPQKEKP